MEDLDNSVNLELDASPLPPLSDRIRFFQQGVKSSSHVAKNNLEVEVKDEDEYVEPPIDYSSPPPVSVRKLLFNNSDGKINYETSSSSSPSCSSTKGLNTRKYSHQQKTKSLSSLNNNANSVASRAKLLDEKASKEEKKAKSKNKMMNAEEDDEEIEKDIAPELLSLADRVKKFSAILPAKKNAKKKYGAAAVNPSSASSYRKLNNKNVPSLAPSSPSSSTSSSSSYINSPYDKSTIASTLLEEDDDGIYSNQSLYSSPPPPPPAPPSHEDVTEFTIVNVNTNNLPYYRNWKSGTIGSSNRKVMKFPCPNNRSISADHSHHRKYSVSSSSEDCWENIDQSSTTSSVSEITYH